MPGYTLLFILLLFHFLFLNFYFIYFFQLKNTKKNDCNFAYIIYEINIESKKCSKQYNSWSFKYMLKHVVNKLVRVHHQQQQQN